MNNNKISKLKNLLLGTTVLTAALGFGAQAWGVTVDVPVGAGNIHEVAAVDVAATDAHFYKLTGQSKLTLTQANVVGGVWSVGTNVGNVTVGTAADVNQSGILPVFLSDATSTKVSRLGAYDATLANRYTGDLRVLLLLDSASDATNGFIPHAPGNLLASADGGSTIIDNGGYKAIITGDLLAHRGAGHALKHTLKINNDDKTRYSETDLSTMATPGANMAGLSIVASGSGSHLYTFADADTTIAGITAAKDTGAIVLAANASAGRTLTMSSFNVDSTSGVMVKNTNAGNGNSLAVVTTVSVGNSATVTMTAGQNNANNGPKGLLSGNNTDAANAYFKVEGTAVVTGVGTMPEISIELAPQAYAHIGSAATAGRYGVYNDTGLTGGAQRYVKAKLAYADAILDMTGAGAAAGAAAYAKQVNGKLTLNTADQVVRLSGKGEVAFNGTLAHMQVAKFFNDTTTAKTHGEFIFANGAVAKFIRFSGAGAQTLTFSGVAAKVDLDNTSGDVTLIWNDSTLTHMIPGLTATVVADKTPTLSLGADDGKGNVSGKAMIFSENVVPAGRKVVINTPVVMSDGGAAKNLTLANGADINSNIILDDLQAHVLTLDGGTDVKQVYNISARAYKGDAHTAAAAGNIQDYLTKYNAWVSTPSASSAQLIAARELINNAVATSLAADLNSVALYTIANGAVVNFLKEKDGSYYVGKTDNAANGVMNLGQDVAFHGELAGSANLELKMAQGSALAVYADSEVKNLTLGPVLTTGSGDSAKNVTSPQTIKFAKVAGGADNAKFDVAADEKITFTGDTNLVLDVSDSTVANGAFTLSTRKLVVTSNVLDKDGKAVAGSAGSVSIKSARPLPNTGTLAAATAADDRNVTFFTESSFGEKDHVLKNFSVSGEHAFTMTLGGANEKLSVYADEVSLAADKDQTFTLDVGAYNFNTSKMSVTSKDSSLTLANAATLNVNALAGTKELAVDFSVAGGKTTFNKGAVVALGKNATKFEDVDFAGGLKFDGAATFVAQDGTPPATKTVNVTGLFAVNQDVVIGAANFAGSDVTSVSVLASVTLTNDQAKEVIFVGDMKKAESAIEIGTDSRFVVNGLVNGGMLNGTNFKVVAAGMVKGETFDLITSNTNIDPTVDTSTFGYVKTVGNERLTLTFVNGGKKAISVCADVNAPTAANLKDAGIELADSEKVAQDLLFAAWNKNIIKTDSPLGKALSSSDKVVGLATKAIAPHAEDIAINVTSDVGAVSSVVGERVAELRVGAASGDIEQPKLGAWVQGSYGQAEQEAFDSVNGYKRSTASGVAGFDFAMNESHLMGLAIGYVSSSSEFTTGLARKDEYATYAFNQYSSHDITESVFLNQNLTFAKATPKRTLKITDGGADVTSSDYEVGYVAFGASLGLSMNLGNAVIFTPTFGGRYQMLSDYEVDYKNVGGDKVDLKTKSVKHSSFVFAGGVSLAYPVQNEDYTFSPEISGGFEYDTNPHKGESSMSLTGLPQTFDADVASVKPTSLSFNAGVALNAKYGMYEFSPKANFSFGKKYSGWTGALKVRVNF
jgi:hypothetical protein